MGHFAGYKLANPNIYRIFAAIKTPKNAAYEQEKVP